MPDDDEYMNATEVAAFTGLTRETIKSYTQRGKLKEVGRDRSTGKRGRPGALYLRRDIEWFEMQRRMTPAQKERVLMSMHVPFTRYTVIHAMNKPVGYTEYVLVAHQEFVQEKFFVRMPYMSDAYFNFLNLYLQPGAKVWIQSIATSLGGNIRAEKIALDADYVIRSHLSTQAQGDS